jgi:hydroxymethylbilane synthase
MSPLIATFSQQKNAVTRLALGARGSALAMWQANAVRDALLETFPGLVVDFHAIRTEGDVDQTSSLMKIGGRGVFASTLQAALLDRAIDLAVHSAKDVPTIEPVGLALAAFPMREDARDAVVSRHGVGLAELPDSPVIGTSSRRRAVQVQAIRPDATVIDLRGNIDTRLRKASTTDYDAVILAAAGLLRMGWQDRIAEYLSIDEFTPSPGQGALAIETRVDPDPAFAIAHSLDCSEVSLAVRLEREFLRAMGGGCTTPVGSYAMVIGDTVHFRAMMASDDGVRLARQRLEFPIGSAHDEVWDMADRMTAELAPKWPGIDLDSTSDSVRPLFRKQVLVTGAQDLVERLSAVFGAEGAGVLSMPTLDISPTSTPDALAAALEQAAIGVFDWLVVTSKQTVPGLVEFGAARLDGKVKIATVGKSTARALAEAGLTVDLVPTLQTGEALIAAFDTMGLAGNNLLCLLGNLASDLVVTGLNARGATAQRVESYQVQGAGDVPTQTREAVRAGRVDLMVFSSPSSVVTAARLLGADLAALSGACLAAIGPTTQGAMESLGLTAHVIADDPDPEGVVAACRRYFGLRAGLGA